MTYKRHWLLSWGGTLAANQDIWSNNVRLTNNQSGSVDSIPGVTLDSFLDDMVTDIRTWMRNPSSYHSGNVQCQWVKLNEIGPDGRYTDTGNTRVRNLVGTSGTFAVINGTATTEVPSFQSVCVTTTTAKTRGRASKGRLFIPQCAPPLVGGGFIDPTAQQAMATAAAAFFSALGDEPGIDATNFRAAVVSGIGDPGPTEDITGVRVGNVLDVIRRRKNAITETYKSAAVSA